MEIDFTETLKKHTEEDKLAFDRLSELLRINGEHMSYIRADLNTTSEDIKEIKSVISLITPMLKDWEKKNLEKEYRDRIGEDVIKWSKRIGAVAVIGSATTWIIKTILK